MAGIPVSPMSGANGDALADPTGARSPVETDAPRNETVAQLVHDLRNPLNVISMNAELVALMAGEASGELGEGLGALGRAVAELERGLERLEAHVAGGT